MFEELIKRYPTLCCCQKQIEQAAEVLKGCFSAGGKLLICGNGGSAADSSHIVGGINEGFLLQKAHSPWGTETSG